MKTALLEKIEQEQIKDKPEAFTIGDTVRVHNKIREGGKERIQIFAGTVIARDGHGASETFTVRRISYGEGTEKVFPINSPNVAQVEVERHGKIRRAKLYYLRDLAGKKARITERREDNKG